MPAHGSDARARSDDARPFGWSLDLTGRRRLSVGAVRRPPHDDARGDRRPGGRLRPGDRRRLHGIDDAYTGAQAWWAAGYTGKGVDVALIDSGIAPVEGLDAPGKVIHGPDLSLESQASNLTNLDTYGHGTLHGRPHRGPGRCADGPV